ncbi:TIGR00295 family protein [Candidatus Bathyarchaeota archaeon]|nr:MAG: TIGR00295 family protein [Candidatus Bathyarchaeota archaeon]HDO72132.1 TIGR00295 family protein [Candidatus Bathyarchaeota archaeon]HEX69140.1 TIGR00295 family protein [Candidatus Bathyarchaeota archaeon]
MKNLPSREQAIRLLHESGCSRNVIKHCKAVTELALEIAKACKEKGLNVDLELVEIGALLHDIGRAKTHSVHHAIIGAKMAKAMGMPEKVISIIKRHVGGGISKQEAERLGWPQDIYIPQTLEEKIVSYADKLINGSRRVPIEKTLADFSGKIPPQAIERIKKLHEEMMNLIGDCKCLP